MPELVSIKAEALKWCPHWFTFFYHEDSEIVEDMTQGSGFLDNKPVIASFEGELYFDELVKVNPKDYTKAVIERIKETFQLEFMKDVAIVKQPGENAITLHCSFLLARNIIPIFIDPQPWLKSYTLEIS